MNNLLFYQRFLHTFFNIPYFKISRSLYYKKPVLRTPCTEFECLDAQKLDLLSIQLTLNNSNTLKGKKGIIWIKNFKTLSEIGKVRE